MLRRLLPDSIRVDSCKLRSSIAVNHSVWVDHRYYIENIHFSGLLGRLFVTC